MKKISKWIWDTGQDGVSFKVGDVVTASKAYRKKHKQGYFDGQVNWVGKITRFIYDDHSDVLPAVEYAELIDLDGNLFHMNERWMALLN